MEKLTSENWKKVFREELGFCLGDWDVSNYPKLKRVKNPWGDGKTSERVVKILEKLEINPKLLNKQISY